MTRTEFWDSLKEVGADPNFKRLDQGIFIRLQKNTNSFCPITAVCQKDLDTFYPNNEWDAAAHDLGLDEDFANNIVDGADGFYKEWYRRKIQRVLSGVATGV